MNVSTDSLDKKICNAVQVIVDNALAKAGFNKTVKGTVIKQIPNENNAYQIKYQDSLFTAYTLSDNISFAANDTVYVLYLNNDTSNNKLILTKVR